MESFMIEGATTTNARRLEIRGTAELLEDDTKPFNQEVTASSRCCHDAVINFDHLMI